MQKTKLFWSGVLICSTILLAGYGVWMFSERTDYSFRTLSPRSTNNEVPNNNYNPQFNNYGMMGGYNRNGNFSTGGYGMMGWGGSSGNEVSQETLTGDQIKTDTEKSLQNAVVDKEKNTITYKGQDIDIVALGSPEEADGKFVIGGLINPTLYIPKDSKVTMEFVNEDKDTPHGIEITNGAPPYAYMTMMQGGIFPGSFIRPLPAASEDKYPTEKSEFTTSYDGNYYYLCQYPGHAEQGMYGEIIIK